MTLFSLCNDSGKLNINKLLSNDFLNKCAEEKVHPMYIDVDEQLPYYMRHLRGENLRLLNVWKIICFSASTAQLAYVLETPNQLRCCLRSDRLFNEKTTSTITIVLSKSSKYLYADIL